MCANLSENKLALSVNSNLTRRLLVLDVGMMLIAKQICASNRNARKFLTSSTAR